MRPAAPAHKAPMQALHGGCQPTAAPVLGAAHGPRWDVLSDGRRNHDRAVTGLWLFVQVD